MAAVLYEKRGIVQRVMSRLKEGLNLKTARVRGINNVKVHVALCLIAMLTATLVAFKTENGIYLQA